MYAVNFVHETGTTYLFLSLIGTEIMIMNIIQVYQLGFGTLHRSDLLFEFGAAGRARFSNFGACCSQNGKENKFDEKQRVLCRLG